jgi:hypothetical protein
MKLTEERVKDAKRLLSAMCASDNSDLFIIRCPNCSNRESIEFVSSTIDGGGAIIIHFCCKYCKESISICIHNTYDENGAFKVLSISPKLGGKE